MRVDASKPGFILLSFALWCAAGAAWADASVSWAPTIEQQRPLFPDISKVYPGHVDNTGRAGREVIGQTQTSTRGWFGRRMKALGILDPQQKVTLRIGSLDGEACAAGAPADVAWAFPQGHYLPPGVDANTDTINIIAWRSFPVQATVTCEGAPAQTYTTWVEVE